MPFNQESLYLTWGGQIGTAGAGTDVWQCGLKIVGPTPGVLPSPNEANLADWYEDTVTPVHTSSATSISQAAVLKWAKAARIGTDGKYVSEPVVHEGAPQQGYAGSTIASPQDAMAITLWSGLTLGKANYGRFYLPYSALPVALANAQIDSGSVAGLLAEAKTFLDETNVWADSFVGDARVVIMSSVGAGTTKVATTVRVGNVRDTQRRRRNGIPEAYQSAVLATP